ncbi:hypothetical protein [Streptosporangium longisporum]
MFDFGVSGYRPEWLTGLSMIMQAQGRRLAALEGRRLTRVLVVWDLEDDTWFTDGPVLLDFDGEQVEIVHNKFDDLSITWNAVDPARPLDWAGTGIPLRWRQDAFPEATALLGQALRSVELLEYVDDDLARGMVALGFVFPHGRMTVYNAMDENGIAFGDPGPSYARHVAGAADGSRDRDRGPRRGPPPGG